MSKNFISASQKI